MNLTQRIAAGTLGIALLALIPEGGTASGPDAPAESVRRTSSAMANWGSLQSAPLIPPRAVQPEPPATLTQVRRYLQASDTRRALLHARRYVEEHPWGRDAASAWMVIGTLERERGYRNLASEAFTRVRLSKGPLESWGAYLEAEVDLDRGRTNVAIRECETYRTRWPKGEFASACQRLIARAHAQEGRATAALEVAEAYDADHPEAPITEQVELAIAEWQVTHQPALAIRRLTKLIAEHNAPLTARVARSRLEELREQGFEDAVLPNDTGSIQARAIAARDSGMHVEAMEDFRELMRRAEDNRGLAAWVHAEAPVFGSRTHSWSFLEEHYQHRYDANPNSADLWQLYRAQSRGGRHQAAAATIRVGLQTYGKSREWRNEEEVLARTFMLAGDYAGARELFDKRSAKGGWTGRRTTFFGAFVSVMAGEHEEAIRRFDAILAKNRSYITESHYWRMKSLRALEREAEADAERAWLAQNAPLSWYDLLAAQGAPQQPLYTRTGAWPGSPLPEPPKAPTPTSIADIPLASWAPSPTQSGARGFTRLAWPFQAALQVTEPEPEPLLLADLNAPPPSYVDNALLSEERALNDLHKLARQHGDAWPQLRVVEDLAQVGLYDMSGPTMAAFHEDWRRAMRSRSSATRRSATALDLQHEDWRSLFFATRDHHHTLRYTYGLHETIDDPALALELQRVSWPLAHDRFVWSHARENELDPFLVLGLMRVESRYSPIAQSRVGARGAMQIMPKTGHLMADLANDEHFTAGDLEDPILSIGYGLSYLSLLMERFDGVYPLAVASYNGGPHNVSSWLKGTTAQMPMDAFVEHIPFRETRNYVKQVTSNYGTYVSLYAPDDSWVAIPAHPLGDHPEVVDF